MNNAPNSNGYPWIDSEVHLLPPEWCCTAFNPPTCETVLRRAIYEHPERELALSRATAEGLLDEMARGGIDRAIIMGLPWRQAEACWYNNAYIARVTREHPDRFMGLAVLPSPSSCDGVDAVRRVHEEYGLLGVKVIPSWQGYRLDDAVFDPILSALCERQMVLMCHTDHAYQEPAHADTAASLLNVARRYPELRILAPHLGGLLCLYGLYEPVRSALTNILFITSVPMTMHMVKWAVEAVGAQQVAFGTDFPFNPSHDQWQVKQAFEQLNLSEPDKRMIAGQSVMRFLEGSA